MLELKLRYFDFNGGRGEVARLAMAIGGVPFELHAGISTFQAMFVSVSHSVGRFVSALTPVRAGPRQFGQFSLAPARVGTVARLTTRTTSPMPIGRPGAVHP